MSVVDALAPALAIGFAVQQFLEVMDPVVEWILKRLFKGDADAKKPLLGLVALAIGLAMAYGARVRVLEPLGVDSEFWDPIVTGIVVSGGTQGFNSIMKFLGYAKESKKAAAQAQRQVSAGAPQLDRT
jgi:hypothetical protein